MTSLLEQMQGLIERTYDLSTGIEDIGAFVIGDEGLRELYGDTPILDRVPEEGGAPDAPAATSPDGAVAAIASGAPAAGAFAADHPALPAGARTLVREADGSLRLSLYYPDTLIEHLEAHHPLRGLDEGNIDAFAVFVEELDHLLHIAHRMRSGRETTLLELEWQANVTKALVTRHFLARRIAPRPLGEAEERWMRFHLFEKLEFTGDDPEIVARYREASRLALRTLAALDPLDPAARLTELRAFARRSFPDKLRSLAV